MTERAATGAARSQLFWLLAILLLGLALRIHDLTRFDVWVDEANGILTAQEALGDIVTRLRRDSSPPLYYFLLHGWMGLVGDSPVAVRALSVLASLGLVGAVYWIGTREISHRVGCWAAFLIAISPTQITYSHQARMYTLLPLVALLAWWFLLRTLRSGSWRDFGWCMAFTSAALYTHNFGLYVLVVLAAMVIVSGQLFRRFWMWLLAVGIQLALYAPWLDGFLEQLANKDHYAWFLPIWKDWGVIRTLENSLRSFSPAGSFVMSPGAPGTDLHGIPAIVVTAFALWGMVRLVLDRRRLTIAGALWLPLACWLPMFGGLAMSHVTTPHYVAGRVDQLFFPAFALLAAAGIAATPPAWLRHGLAAAFLGCSLLGIGLLEDSPYAAKFAFLSSDDIGAAGPLDGRGRRVRHGRKKFRGSDSDMAAAILKRWRPGDVILCTSLTRAPVEYYLRRSGIEPRMINFPRYTARNLGAQNVGRLAHDRESLRREAKTVLDEARELTRPDGRLFILRSKLKVNDVLLPSALRNLYYVFPESNLGQFKQTGTFEHIVITLNSMHAPAPAESRAGAGAEK